MNRRLRRAFVIVAVVGTTLLSLGAAMRDGHVPVTTTEVAWPGEDEIVARLVRKATAAIAEEAAADRLYKRDAHAKPHGCVIARLRVAPDLDVAYRHGVFSEPGRAYQAWVRFSNGTMSDDTKPDARGMGIKLMDVPGVKLLTGQDEPATQDFVMINYPTFFLRDLSEYEEFFGYQAAGKPMSFFIGWNPLRWHLHGLYHAARMEHQRVGSPLATRYYSMSAYRLGPQNIKFGARPCTPRDAPRPRRPGPNYLREALVRELREASACFELVVQRQDATKEMPIEDPSVEWRESDSPYVAVARLDIPRQEFSTDVQNRFCESLSFSPWHALAEHRPLGNLNRARRAVYAAISQRRHARNSTRQGEPRGWCLDLSGEPCPPGSEVRPL